jgi:hypothetical protein
MKRILTMLALIGLVAGVIGCAADPLVKPSWTLNEGMFRQLVPGQSTTSDAFAVLGKPVLQMTFERMGEEVWDYRYMDYATHMYAMVYFDRMGVYKGYASQLDWAYYSGGSSAY